MLSQPTVAQFYLSTLPLMLLQCLSKQHSKFPEVLSSGLRFGVSDDYGVDFVKHLWTSHYL
jgi:hypothetical protein